MIHLILIIIRNHKVFLHTLFSNVVKSTNVNDLEFLFEKYQMMTTPQMELLEHQQYIISALNITEKG